MELSSNYSFIVVCLLKRIIKHQSYQSLLQDFIYFYSRIIFLNYILYIYWEQQCSINIIRLQVSFLLETLHPWCSIFFSMVYFPLPTPLQSPLSLGE